jgi:hypothetical protein
MARRRRRRDRHAVALTTPPTSQTPTPPRPGRPEYRKVWAWVSIAVIPLLVGGAIALYSARLALDQAGEQEAHAQSGANRAEDADLARSPAVLARVRPTYSGPNWVWVFPQVLDEATVAELAGPSRQWFETEGARLSQEQIVAIGERATARIRELGGVLGAWGYVGQQRKSTTTHLVSLVGNRREKVRIVDIRARVLEKSPRLDGTLLLYLGEGVDDVEQVGVDLDDPSGRLTATTADGVTKPLLDTKSLSLDKGEEVGLEITALSAAHSYRWELELTVEHGTATRETVRVRADGTTDGPTFHTTAWDSDSTYTGGVYRRDNGTYALVRQE